MPTDATQLGQTLGWLLTAAWLLPLAGFVIEIFGGGSSDNIAVTITRP